MRKGRAPDPVGQQIITRPARRDTVALVAINSPLRSGRQTNDANVVQSVCRFSARTRHRLTRDLAAAAATGFSTPFAVSSARASAISCNPQSRGRPRRVSVSTQAQHQLEQRERREQRPTPTREAPCEAIRAAAWQRPGRAERSLGAHQLELRRGLGAGGEGDHAPPDGARGKEREGKQRPERQLCVRRTLQ